MKIPIESFQKKTEYSINIYGAFDVRLFPNKHLNVDLKNIEICFIYKFCLVDITLLLYVIIIYYKF